MFDRRDIIIGGVALASSLASARAAFATLPGGARLAVAIKQIEADSGGRLGVSVLDRTNNFRFAYRGAERFAMCSTFKLLLAAAVLARVDGGRERLDRSVTVTAADIIAHSPIASRYVGGPGASVAILLEAMMIESDNAAANLLLPTIGGPAGLTRWLRRTGDPVTRLDRNEPSMSTAITGDPRDTTSPNAMVATLARLTMGTTLSEASRSLVIDWMIDNRTGDRRLRAGLRPGWRIGDKTGTGDNGTTNDVAIVWPGAAPPVVIAAYLTQSPLHAAQREAIIARTGRAIAEALTPVR